MAAILPNGVVLEVPYAIIKVFRNARPYSVAVVDRNQQTRANPATDAEADLGIFVYAGDTIRFELAGAAGADNYPVFDLVQVNFSTGVETTQTTLTMTALWQKRLKVTISAINASSGLVTFTTNHS